MPKLTIDGESHEVEAGTRLVNAIEACGVDVGHRCGGWARCTTCRVEFAAGEPERMTRAEQEKLADASLEGIRLSCQCLVEGDMELTVLMHVSENGWSDPGPPPADEITPDPEWVSADEG